EQLVGRSRARTVYVGELDDEVVDRQPLGGGAHAATGRLLRQPVPACVVSSRNFCMSQAPVGQRSAQSPQCRQTSSSLTMMRPVPSVSETYSGCSGLSAGAVSRCLSSSSPPFAVKLMQSIGQMSTQASHSMHLSRRNTVCTSQLRQRWASFHAVS